MTGRSPIFLALLLAAGFTATILYLLGAEFASGGVYPEYSSLRADPQGCKLLFDSLARLPGVSVERSYVPLDLVQGDHATVLLPGLDAEAFAKDSEAFLQPIEKLAARGNRVVVALEMKPDAVRPRGDALERQWRVKFGLDRNRKHSYLLYFSEAAGWTVLDSIGPKLLAIERLFGQGSVVLMSTSDDFNNASTVAADRLKLVSAAIGPNRRILFDEQHLGISESGSVVGLARRFHLVGLGFGLAVCAALFIWKNSSTFPPPVARPQERMSGRTSLSGLLTLLRRHIPASEVAAVCWREWLSANRREVTPERAGRAEAVLRASAGRPLEAVREIQAVVHSKGTL